jgi:hypothetical protein
VHTFRGASEVGFVATLRVKQFLVVDRRCRDTGFEIVLLPSIVHARLVL